uniref:Uncharacterized protein n=1 Tax=Euplotes crassus TaxID=5936 RepID=A0A7S3KAG3_EUPCR|mmetsp:Transcript_17847/g.17571  ORF Transcript_17847/g.17571 Transcript_17847/m.17571 type:complete len:181 (+) Transcript_17847:81-623(+)
MTSNMMSSERPTKSSSNRLNTNQSSNGTEEFGQDPKRDRISPRETPQQEDLALAEEEDLEDDIETSPIPKALKKEGSKSKNQPVNSVNVMMSNKKEPHFLRNAALLLASIFLMIIGLTFYSMRVGPKKDEEYEQFIEMQKFKSSKVRQRPESMIGAYIRKHKNIESLSPTVNIQQSTHLG